jgi:hypothetical protein
MSRFSITRACPLRKSRGSVRRRRLSSSRIVTGSPISPTLSLPSYNQIANTPMFMHPTGPIVETHHS